MSDVWHDLEGHAGRQPLYLRARRDGQRRVELPRARQDRRGDRRDVEHGRFGERIELAGLALGGPPEKPTRCTSWIPFARSVSSTSACDSSRSYGRRAWLRPYPGRCTFQVRYRAASRVANGVRCDGVTGVPLRRTTSGPASPRASTSSSWTVAVIVAASVPVEGGVRLLGTSSLLCDPSGVPGRLAFIGHPRCRTITSFLKLSGHAPTRVGDHAVLAPRARDLETCAPPSASEVARPTFAQFFQRLLGNGRGDGI
jgi:hypothetical protein